MNREIKFRAKCLITKQFEVGYYVKDYSGACYITSLDGQDTTCVDEDTIGQFIGLKDKNGKDIYEGDICFFKNSKGTFKCEIRHHECAFRHFQIGYKYNYMPTSINSNMVEELEFEVIGNIHENPELI